MTIFGRALDLAGALVDGDDGEDDAALGEVLAVADDDVFDDVDGAAGVDADAADGDFAVLARRESLSSSRTSPSSSSDGVFDDAGAGGEFGVALEVAVVAVDGDEELGPQQVDHQAQLFLRAVAADVDEALRAVVVDDAGVAALEVVDHADRCDFSLPGMTRELRRTVSPASMRACLWLLTAARRERGHGLALRAGDEDHELVGG